MTVGSPRGASAPGGGGAALDASVSESPLGAVDDAAILEHDIEWRGRLRRRRWLNTTSERNAGEEESAADHRRREGIDLEAIVYSAARLEGECTIECQARECETNDRAASDAVSPREVISARVLIRDARQTRPSSARE